MIDHSHNTGFENISQRAVYPFLVSLISFSSQYFENGSNANAAFVASGKEFHAFLETLYETLYLHPGQFGLPETEDISIIGDEPDPKQHKQIVKRKLDNPRKSIEAGLSFLLLAGQRGTLEDDSLRLEKDTYDDLVKECRIKKKFLSGLEKLGFGIAVRDVNIIISDRDHPKMMLAMKALAAAAEEQEDFRIGNFHFARADFRGLDSSFVPSAQDLYSILDPIDVERLSRLHDFFLDLNYKTLVRIDRIHAWDVQYQGPTRIKASPLLRIQYDPRCQIPLQAAVKLASTRRIVNLVYQQPRFLQEDFARRVNDCGGCGWCKNRKGLGATVFKFDGQRRTICWHHKSEIPELDEKALEIVKLYALMHEALA